MLSRPLVGAVVALLVASTGCYRGESKSLSEVYTNARSAYMSAPRNEVPPTAASMLEKITSSLDGISDGAKAGSTTATEKARELATLLSDLSEHVNPTVRPAMAELVSQYLEMSSAPTGVTTGAPQARLLASRTYRLLAAELTSTKFRL